MSQTVITQAFEALKAQEAANGGVVTLDEFVFASVPNLNITDPISRTEGLPPDAQIVYRQAVSKTGMVNSNAVVYSVVLGADVGDFEFNWVGLLNKASGVVAMIVHAPSQKKIKTASGQQGNVLTRSFLMEYNGASTQTQITTPADTWQIDFTARLNGVDERARIENTDLYGAASFLGDGFKVSKNGTKYAVEKGTAYIAGLRAELLFNQDMTVSNVPSKIWVDVSWQGTMTSVWAAQTRLTVAAELNDYVENDAAHHVYAIAEIMADGSVKDLRPVGSEAERKTQPRSPLLSALSGMDTKADTILYFTGKDLPALTPLTQFVRGILSKDNVAGVLESIGLEKAPGKLLELVSISDYLVNGDVAAAIISALEATTGTVIVPPGNFTATPTIAQVPAVLRLLSRAELRGKLTIKLPTGKATLREPVLVQVAGGENLSLIGQDSIDVNITGQVSVSGNAGNYLVTLSVNSTAGIAVGDYLHTNQASGTGACDVHRGAWRITAIGSGTITVRNTCWLAAFPANTIFGSGSRVLKSTLRFENCDGLVVPASVVGNLANIALEGNSDEYWLALSVSSTEKGTHGITVGSNTVTSNGKADSVNPQGISGGSVSCGKYVGINGFDQQGVVTELGGRVWGDYLCSCNNKRRGIYASTASGIRAKQISANGNYLDGVIADLGGDVYASNISCAVGNGASGISATQNGVIAFDTGRCSYNKTNGVNGAAGGFAQMTGGVMTGNLGCGVLLVYGAIGYIDNSALVGNGTYGIDLQVGAMSRMNTCTITANGTNGIRISQGSKAVYTGSSISGNTGADVNIREGGIAVNGNDIYGGPVVATELRLLNYTTGKGAKIATTTGGDDLIILHDTAGNGSYTEAFHFRSGDSGFYAGSDAFANIGRAANRFNVGFFAGGTQSTSDARLKDPVREFTPQELNAAMKLAKMFGFWTWLDDEAKRLHAGTTVQEVLRVLEEEGLDWHQYGFIGFDQWGDEYKAVTRVNEEGDLVETGELQHVRHAGSLWQLRDQDFDRFVMRGLSQRISNLEERLEGYKPLSQEGA